MNVFSERGLSEECMKQGAAIPVKDMDDIGALFAKADAYSFGGLPDKAIPVYQSILQLDPANAAAQWHLVMVLASSLQAKKAIDAGETYFEKFGEDAIVHVQVAFANHMLGDLDQAEIHYERADALSGGPSNLYLGMLYKQRGDTAKASSYLRNLAKSLEENLRGHPSNFKIAGALADCYALLKKYDEADKLLAQARQSSYVSGEGLIARTLLLTGRSQTAGPIIHDLVSNQNNLLWKVRMNQAIGFFKEDELSGLKKEGLLDKLIELESKLRAMY